jgi:O-antigen/teichoic acid export membrane protein
MTNNVDDGYGIARGAVYVISKNLISGVSMSVFFLFLVRLLPEISDLGLINGLNILIILGVAAAGLGLPNAVTRFMSYYIGANRGDLAKKTCILILKLGIISSIVISSTLFLLAETISTLFFHDVNYAALIQLVSIDVFVFSMLTISYYILYAYQEFKIIALILILDAFLRVVLSILLLGLGLGIFGILAAFISSDVICLAIFVRMLAVMVRGASPTNASVEAMSMTDIRPKVLFRYSLPIFASQLMSFLSVNMDYYTLLFLSSLYVAGIYSPAIFISMLLLAILAGLGEALLPYLSRIYGSSNGIRSLDNVSRYASRYLFLIFFPLCFAILFCVPLLIIGIFGDQYSESIYPSVIIILAIIFASVGTIFNYILMSAGHANVFFFATLTALVLQLIIATTTIPIYGILGAAIARASAFVVMFLYITYTLKQLAGLHIDTTALKVGTSGSIILGIVVFSMNTYFGQNLYILPFSLLTGFASYLIFLRGVQAINVQDFILLDSVFPGKLKIPLGLIKKLVIR